MQERSIGYSTTFPASLRRSTPDAATLLFFLILTLLLGVYATHLNSLFYQKFGPFFDSMSYHNQMAFYLDDSKVRGTGAAFWSAVRSSTSILAWIELLPFAATVEPSRSLSIWLQVPWLLTLSGSAFFYFHRTIGYSRTLSIASALPLIFIAGIFNFNGGLSDFRIDLLAYATFGTSCITYLIARNSHGLYAWAVWGFFLGVAILGRPPLMVYSILIFGPFLVIDLAQNKSWFFIRYGLGAGIAFLLAGWFLIVQRDYLYYYYVVWNADANASLHLAESISHLKFVVRAIGYPVLIFLGAMFVYRSIAHFSTRESSAPLKVLLSDINFRPLWCGVVPVGYLVLSGSGLNPFVSMVSVTGLSLFLCAPFQNVSRKQNSAVAWIMLALAACSCASTALQGIAMHTDETIVSRWIPRRDALNSITREIEASFKEHPQGAPLRYEIGYTGGLSSSSLENILIFDSHWHFVDANRRAVTNGHWNFEDRTLFNRFGEGKDAASAWQKLPGQSDGDRVNGLIEVLLRDVDLIFMPTVDSKIPDRILINRYSAQLTQRLKESKCVDVVADNLKITDDESVTIFKNLRRATSGKASCT